MLLQQPPRLQHHGTRARACDLCVKRKRKCTGDGKNCTLCTQKGRACSYTQRDKHMLRAKRPRDDADVVDGGPPPYAPPRSGSSSSSGGASAAQQQLVAATALMRGGGGGGGGGGAALGTGGGLLLAAPRLSPSTATGLLGLRENDHLRAFLRAYTGVARVRESDVQRSVMAAAAAANAGTAFLWAAIAYGAQLQGGADTSAVNAYLARSRDAIKDCYDDATPEVLRATLLLADVYASAEDYTRFYRYVGLAASVARGIAGNRPAAAVFGAASAHASDGSAAAQAKPHVDDDLWFLLEALRVVRSLMDTEARIEDKTSSDKIMARVLGLCPAGLDEDALREGRDSSPGTVVACFVPTIEGLPSYSPDELQAVVEEGGCIRGPQARQMVRHNICASALTALAQPETGGVDALVSAATKGKTILLPVVLSIDLRVVQVMQLSQQSTTPPARALLRAAGARVLRVLERVMRSLGQEYLLRPGFNQLMLITDAIFLRLLARDEEGAQEGLRHMLRLVREAPGLLRFPVWPHTAHFCAALLLSAGMRDELDELTRLYNGLGLDGGHSRLPEDDAGRAAMCQCPQFCCAGVHRAVADNLTSGGARIFVRNTLWNSPGVGAAAASMTHSHLLTLSTSPRRAPPVPLPPPDGVVRTRCSRLPETAAAGAAAAPAPARISFAAAAFGTPAPAAALPPQPLPFGAPAAVVPMAPAAAPAVISGADSAAGGSSGGGSSGGGSGGGGDTELRPFLPRSLTAEEQMRLLGAGAIELAPAAAAEAAGGAYFSFSGGPAACAAANFGEFTAGDAAAASAAAAVAPLDGGIFGARQLHVVSGSSSSGGGGGGGSSALIGDSSSGSGGGVDMDVEALLRDGLLSRMGSLGSGGGGGDLLLSGAGGGELLVRGDSLLQAGADEDLLMALAAEFGAEDGDDSMMFASGF